MLHQALLGFALLATCVVVHATGVALVLWRLRGTPAGASPFWATCWLFIRLAGWMVILHLVEISLWGLFYGWRGAVPDMASALYFSAVTYTTTGYGDVVLPAEWRLVGAMEALTGILMCGWSTGFFFAAVARLMETRKRPAISSL